jgi:hypothetical protein
LHVRAHDLRHAHASWLLAGGADLQTVKERLGHGIITTTEQYLHTLTGADDTALTALTRTRQTGRPADRQTNRIVLGDRGSATTAARRLAARGCQPGQ